MSPDFFDENLEQNLVQGEAENNHISQNNRLSETSQQNFKQSLMCEEVCS